MLWQQCLQQLEQHLSDQDINTWLRTLHSKEAPNTLFLLAPNPFVLKQVNDSFLPIIQERVQAITEDNQYQVVLQIGTAETAPDLQAASTNTLRQLATRHIPLVDEDRLLADQQPSELSAEDIAKDLEPATRFVGNVNHKMHFNNFVEGNSNQLARAAALQVADNPGHAYNPLFIYGGVGLGKTHLMHAIGNRIMDANEGAKVLYLHSERFVTDMVTALKNNRIDEFKRYYRNVDALLIDDIQFFAGKDRSMEEFFHTFNALLEGHKQLILTSDKFPRDVEGIEDRLRTRFNWGLTVQIEPPELETRVAILRKKAEELDLIMPNDVAFFMAKRFRSNIRDMEGALKRVVATVKFRNQDKITMDFVQHALRDQLASQEKLITIDNIKKTIAQYYNIRVADLDSKKRTRNVARPRQMAMAMAKELTAHSFPEIGIEFGGRDHTTALHACRKVKELVESDTQFEEDYRILLRTLTS
ncbi:MAG TPA: chromosomal replication initiator protein DnaA [Thiothrix sp.]|nr:chromosomal replication initiator protein DnaA [Thiothrix sp.]